MTLGEGNLIADLVSLAFCFVILLLCICSGSKLHALLLILERLANLSPMRLGESVAMKVPKDETERLLDVADLRMWSSCETGGCPADECFNDDVGEGGPLLCEESERVDGCHDEVRYAVGG